MSDDPPEDAAAVEGMVAECRKHCFLGSGVAKAPSDAERVRSFGGASIWGYKGKILGYYGPYESSFE